MSQHCLGSETVLRISGGRTTDHHEPAPVAAVSNTDEPWLKQPGSGTSGWSMLVAAAWLPHVSP